GIRARNVTGVQTCALPISQDFHHGVRVIELNDAPRPIRTIATAIIGLVGTAPEAAAADFPLDEPVLVTDIYDAIGKIGAAGTLKAALTAISDQANPVIVVVRVEAGADTGDRKSVV